MESVLIRTRRKADPEDLKKTLAKFKGLNPPSAPHEPIIVR